MRIIELQLEGFTSFRDGATLNLEGVELFAITGPTGAGKTSLIDALTFALFGEVGRVGREVGQLISQNRAVLKVMLTFEVSGQTFRVTRRRPRKGAAGVVLERLQDAEWVSAGEGSDRVEPVNRMISEVLGLDFEGFTRAVVLPQGRFAEFLQGDRKGRRDILNGLLGLERIAALGKQARDAAKELKVRGDAKAEILQGSLADATNETLRARSEELTAARSHGDKLDALAEDLEALIADVEKADARRAGLSDARAKIFALQQNANDCAATLATLTQQRQKLAEEAEARRGDVERSEASRVTLEKQLEEHRGIHGDEERLDVSKDQARRHAEAVEACARLRSRISEGESKIATAASELDAARESAQLAAADIAAKQADHDRATHQLDTARRKDHAAAACEGLASGDPCPICGNTIEQLPSPSADLETAAAEVERTRKALTTAMDLSRGAEADVAKLQERCETFQEHLENLRGDLSQAEAELGKLTADLGGLADEDEEPAAERVERLIAERRALLEGLQQASTSSGRAQLELSKAEGELANCDVRIEHEQQKLDSVLSKDRLPDLKELGLAAPPDLQLAALSELLGSIDAAAASLEGLEEQLLERANAAAAGALPPFEDASRIAAGIASARREADRSIAVIEESIRTLEKRIEERRGLEAEVREIGARVDRLQFLGERLKSNEFIAWLQEDALRALCRSGSQHLKRLTGQRYRLEIDADKDEFVVHDTWNGDEPRSAKTLSGGETFLASLALALSLADEVARLRVDQSISLETLLIDEGFGSLDPGSLDDVVEALELLAASGRAVGLVTHLEGLAQRIPTRFEIDKHESGSSIGRTG